MFKATKAEKRNNNRNVPTYRSTNKSLFVQLQTIV